MGRQASALLFGKGGCPLFEHLERGGGILGIVVGGMRNGGAQQLVVRARILQLLQDQLPELLQLGVAVSGFFYFFGHNFSLFS